MVNKYLLKKKKKITTKLKERKSAAGCEWDFIHDFSNTMLYIMMLVETQVLPEIENVASFLLHE